MDVRTPAAPVLTPPESRSCRTLTLEQEVTLARKERDVAQANERAAAVEWKRSQDEVAALKKQLQKVGFELEDALERVEELRAKATLARAEADAAGSLLLEVQAECVAARQELDRSRAANVALSEERERLALGLATAGRA